MLAIQKLSFFFVGAGLVSATFAANTPIEQSPLKGGISSSVRANVMFILDDSGSMEFPYVPDVVGTSESKYAYRSPHCNGMAYDPAINYKRPLLSDGTELPNATFTAAWEDGFRGVQNSTSSVTIGTGSKTFTILGSPFSISTTVGSTVQITAIADRNAYMVGTVTSWGSSVLKVNVTTTNGAGAYNSWNVTNLVNLGVATGSYKNRYFAYTGAESDMAYEYNADGSVKANTFRNECNSNIGSVPGAGKFTEVTMSSVSSDAQNYANWYSYYRLRRNTFKSAMSRVFGTMLNPDRFRIGYNTINYTATSNADPRYLDIGDYCGSTAPVCAQRNLLFSKIYGTPPTSSTTPLRGALSRAGLIYAGKLVTGARDPVQYACQKNFTILTTDGYWNETSPAGRTIPAGACTGNVFTGCPLGMGDQDSASQTDYKAYKDPYAPTAMQRPQTDGSNSGSGTSDALADSAMYYYKKVIRDSGFGNCTSGSTTLNLCPDAGKPGKVPVSVRGGVEAKERWDCNRFLHMNTYTIGLGVTGLLDSDGYLDGSSDDYNELKKVLGGTVNWPAILNNNQTGVDDLWHAAVNGRGEYYSANNPTTIVSSISKALAAIGASMGTGNAAGSSSQQLNAGDKAFLARYDSENWSGDVQALELDPGTGALKSVPTGTAAACDADAEAGNPVWSARDQLNKALVATPDASSRTIYMSVGGGLGSFGVANVANADFDPTTLTQYAGFSATEKAQATKASLVAYLRGVSKISVAGPPVGTCCEDRAGNTYRLYRDRGDGNVLGDIVGSSPYFVGKSPFNYGDAGYATYRDTTTAIRRRVVYAGANDGMLHAFDDGVPPAKSGTGNELWAFIPTAVLSNLHLLADFSYNGNHRFFVDGPMNVGDISDENGAWKTLLVGGLGGGGRDYYALNVTDPSNPVLAWEFRAKNPGHADNMGLSFATPVITKRASDGKWVVLLSSGYNNESPGDGKGHLFVVDAATGVVIDDIQTSTIASADKSGLSGLANWVDTTMTNNSTRHVYAGDLAGNLWRFDITTATAKLLANFSDAGGIAQPIVRRPEIGEVTMGVTKNHWVFVGTGKALTEKDVDTTLLGNTASAMQSLYAVRDDLANTYAGSFRNVAGVVAMDLQGAGETRQLQYVPAGTSAPGWYFDFDVVSGEKVSTDVTLQVGWLTFGTRVPNPLAGVCDRKVLGFQYFVDYNPQSARKSESTWEINYLGDAAVTGATVLQTSTGETVVVVTDQEGNIKVIENKGDAGSGKVRRVTWRELVN